MFVNVLSQASTWVTYNLYFIIYLSSDFIMPFYSGQFLSNCWSYSSDTLHLQLSKYGLLNAFVYIYIPRKLWLWGGILFSRCLSVRPPVRNAVLCPRHFQWGGHIVSPLSVPTSILSVRTLRNTFGFRVIIFERIGVLD